MLKGIQQKMFTFFRKNFEVLSPCVNYVQSRSNFTDTIYRCIGTNSQPALFKIKWHPIVSI